MKTLPGRYIRIARSVTRLGRWLCLLAAFLLATASLSTNDLRSHADGLPDKSLLVPAANEGHAHNDHPMAMESVKVGDLEIVSPMIRATPPNAPVSAGYMMIRNTGSQPDRLVGASASFAGKVEIHEMAMQGDVMKMREIEGGLEIPAGEEIKLERGGLHMMFMHLDGQLMEGETRTITLEFERAGSIQIQLPVGKVDGGHHGNHESH